MYIYNGMQTDVFWAIPRKKFLKKYFFLYIKIIKSFEISFYNNGFSLFSKCH